MLFSSENTINIEFVIVPLVKVMKHSRLQGEGGLEGQNIMSARLFFPKFFWKKRGWVCLFGVCEVKPSNTVPFSCSGLLGPQLTHAKTWLFIPHCRDMPHLQGGQHGRISRKSMSWGWHFWGRGCSKHLQFFCTILWYLQPYMKSSKPCTCVIVKELPHAMIVEDCDLLVVKETALTIHGQWLTHSCCQGFFFEKQCCLKASSSGQYAFLGRSSHTSQHTGGGTLIYLVNWL